jgi:hypothetical protein
MKDGEMSYQEFLALKTQLDQGNGFEGDWAPEFLYGFQSALVDWSLQMGRSAIFADCGLGKTPMQLVWAENVRRHTGKPVLVVTPLAVSFQTVREAEKFGIEAATSRDGTIPAGITVTNYERLENFDPTTFGGVVCDESSAIKAFDGKRRQIVTDFMRKHEYRLLCTATAAPNDYIELGTSSEALSYMGHIDMLNRFFTNKNNTSDTKGHWRGHAAPRVFEGQQWRFKGHAEQAFWRWVASWARAIRRPSDMGYPDTGFDLPDLILRDHVVHTDKRRDPDQLFDLPAQGLRDERAESRLTIRERCEQVADLLSDADSAVAWCQLNDESALVTKLIDGAVEVSGGDSPESKEEKLLAFSAGQIRHLVTKPVIGAWGLNWQHCNRMTFFPSHSYEQYYQAVRRSWRFGQTRPVVVDIITTEGGGRALKNLKRKADQADMMFDQLVTHMHDALSIQRETHDREVKVPTWLTS